MIAARVRELRKRQDWTADQLAKELQAVGIEWDRSIVTNLELGRRKTVSVEELLALAYVLGVAPVHLLVPPDAGEDHRYRVVPAGLSALRPETARRWIAGSQPIKAGPGGVIDGRRYFFEAPPGWQGVPRFTSPAPVQASADPWQGWSSHVFDQDQAEPDDRDQDG